MCDCYCYIHLCTFRELLLFANYFETVVHASDEEWTRKKARISGLRVQPGTQDMYSFEQDRTAMTCLNVKGPTCEHCHRCWIPPDLATDPTFTRYECEAPTPDELWAGVEKLVHNQHGRYSLGERRRGAEKDVPTT